MGAKYLPTNRDLKLGQRFQRLQAARVKVVKTSAVPAAPKPAAKPGPAPAGR
jgi:hypothetical protein